MSDDNGSVSELERSVLRSDRELRPPAGAEAAVWSKLSAELGLPASLAGVAALTALSPNIGGEPSVASSSGTGTAAAGTQTLLPAATSTLAFVKGLVVGVLASGALWQGHHWLNAPEPGPDPGLRRAWRSAPADPAIGLSEPAATPVPPEAQGELERSPPGSENRHATRRAEPPPNLEPSGTPSVAAFGEEIAPVPLSPAQRASQLREEAELLRRARAQLLANDLAGALASLETSRRRFSTAELYQEREALSIELLHRTGEAAAAAARARTFLSAFPESPHAARLKGIALPGRPDSLR